MPFEIVVFHHKHIISIYPINATLSGVVFAGWDKNIKELLTEEKCSIPISSLPRGGKNGSLWKAGEI